jgi:RimJ/RimL family protein N-acetyltransferase/nucleotide-binding universal stress UspA family protein
MAGESRTVIVRDGSELCLRPLQPADRPLLAEAMTRLSPESRYRRFFGPHAELSPRELDYLTQIDHHDHEAVVALEADGRAVGVARFVRLREDPGRAEAAVAVVDDWHGRGVARVLLERLSERAREEGIHHFTAIVQAENQRAVGALSALGPTARASRAGVVDLDIELAPEGLGNPLETALRAAAGELLGTAPLAARIRRKARELWSGPTEPAAEPRPVRAPVLTGAGVSPPALRALECAASLADAVGAPLHLVAGFKGAEAREEAEERLRRAVRALPVTRPPVVVHAQEGRTAEVLLALAGELEAGLVVVWPVGEGDLGAVAERVVRRAGCHVLVAR